MDRRTLKITEIAVWKDKDIERLAWSPDGKNPLLFGKNYHGSTMPPSWLVTK
jgi:hypothetical protein